MTQYELNASYSTLATLSVIANPAITNLAITGPSSPQNSGALLNCVFTYSNISGGAGTVTFTLKNQAGTTLGTLNVAVPGGTSGLSNQISFTMPGSDVTITVTSNYGGSASATIQVLVMVATSITLTLNPTSVVQGGTVTASGNLSRQDNPSNYSGVSGATIQILDSNNNLIATGTAGSTGAYSITFTAPATVGTYQYKAYFAGSGVLSAAYTEASVSTGAESALPLLIIGAIILGAIFIK